MALTSIGVAPIVLKDMTLIIDDYEFAAAIAGVVFTPKATTVTWKGGTPTSRFSDSVVDSWDCKIDYAQDHVTANSLSTFLLAHSGEKLDCQFRPSNAAAAGYEATLNIVPGPIGGQVGQFMTGSVTLGVEGEPEIVTFPLT